MHGIIIGDSFYDEPRTSISRVTGAHRMATLFRSKGVNVEVLDFFNSWTIDELSIFLSKYVTLDFIGISAGLGKLKQDSVNKFISLVKQKYPEVKILAGGSDVLTTSYKNVDLYIRGFADGAIDDIIKYIQKGRYPNVMLLKTIKTHDVKIVIDCNEHYKSFDLSNLRTIYTDNDFISSSESLTLETGRGCIFKCKFCNFPLTGKKKNDYIREKDDIKSEILDNYNQWGITRYSITDDTFNDNPIKVDILYEISQEIPFKLELMCYARVDLLQAHESMLEKMMASGFRGMFFGIESMKSETSRAIGKKFTGERLRNYLIEIKKKYPELHLTGSFIVGLPEESSEDIDSNIEWLMENNIFDCVTVFPLGIPLDNSVNYVSPFTAEWEKYGYTQMDLNEVHNLIEMHPEKYAALKNINFKQSAVHNILWKNNYMNFLDARIIYDSIKNKIEDKNKMGGWNCFSMTYTGIPLDTILKTVRTEFDWDDIFQRANNYVHTYKTKKLSISV